MFLVRTAFWLSIVVLFIPTGESDVTTTTGSIGTTEDNISAFEAISAAQATVSDFASFCERNPQTCETGSEALKVFSQKAQYGAKKLYEYISETNTAGNAAEPGEAAAGAVDTLRPEDRAPDWQGPARQG